MAGQIIFAFGCLSANGFQLGPDLYPSAQVCMDPIPDPLCQKTIQAFFQLEKVPEKGYQCHSTCCTWDGCNGVFDKFTKEGKEKQSMYPEGLILLFSIILFNVGSKKVTVSIQNCIFDLNRHPARDFKNLVFQVFSNYSRTFSFLLPKDWRKETFWVQKIVFLTENIQKTNGDFCDLKKVTQCRKNLQTAL